jgi:surface polysaccharide O-acyltransferase-like enzyme
MNIDTRLIFSVLGPLFLVLSGWRYIKAGRLVPQAKTWLIIGIIFSAVAAWLWFGPGYA